nr:RHS repeat-associated core domain-containing protein [uncultured Pseudomonas sp.]
MNDPFLRRTYMKVPDSSSPSVANCSYSPYGFYQRSIASRLAYTGQLKDAVTGCYHLGNGYRAYNPSLMRFQAADSLSPFDKGGLNAYAYCGGDPVNRIDPDGHFFGVAQIILRVLGMASNAVTLVYNFLGPVPVNRIGLNAARLSTLGAVSSLMSSVAQAAGVESAVFGANVGTGVSLLATSVRAVNAAFGPGTKPWTQIKENWKLMTSGVPEIPPPPESVLEMVSTTRRSGLSEEVRSVAYDVNQDLYRRKLRPSKSDDTVAQRRRSAPPILIRQS